MMADQNGTGLRPDFKAASYAWSSTAFPCSPVPESPSAGFLRSPPRNPYWRINSAHLSVVTLSCSLRGSPPGGVSCRNFGGKTAARFGEEACRQAPAAMGRPSPMPRLFTKRVRRLISGFSASGWRLDDGRTSNWPRVPSLRQSAAQVARFLERAA
ncbi:hypothetical protein FQR65_LT20791 [Abscondita terminalis]|nr:hypothetical protein FQR65_LT20791 [Abscondita terminalis]